jgi:hypothetical protein
VAFLKDLFDKLFGALPLYSRQMSAMLRGPKAAILQMDLKSDSALQDALTFLAVSFAIAFIAQIPFLPEKQDKEMLFGVLAVQAALGFVLNVVIVVLAWRIVGGKLASKKILVASCYFCGVSTIIFLAVSLVAAGAFKLLDPVEYQEVMTGTADPFSMLDSGGSKVFFGLLAVGMLAAFAWIVCVWGAYREFMHLSKVRSAIALLIFMTLSPVLLLAQSLMTLTIMATRTTPVVPTELVGVWYNGGFKDAGDVRTTGGAVYEFAPPKYKMLPAGTYTMRGRMDSNNGKCVVVKTRYESGALIVRGSTIKLVPFIVNDAVDDQCAGKRWQNPTNLSRIEYQYKLDQKPTGWTLCLSNRLGGFCLVPKA